MDCFWFFHVAKQLNNENRWRVPDRIDQVILSLVIAGEQGVPDLKMKIKNFSVNVGGREATGWKTKLSLSPMIVGVRGVTVWNSKFTNDDVAVSGISAAEGVRNVLLLGGAPLFGISMMTIEPLLSVYLSILLRKPTVDALGFAQL
uniref:Uncharacterized protein n=1 Tax=Ananas comosus var. bracteatus TaxID=296719 RepID=A0A6V7PH50_ANACO|nr:unnamed protein product [Ananas comosus var. bracteatus]